MQATRRIPHAKPRRLALGIAAIMAASAHDRAASAVAQAAPSGGTIVVQNCNDSGPGSLRDAITSAASGDIIDLTQLACSTISLTTGALEPAQSDVYLKGPGAAQLTIDGTHDPGYAVIYHAGGGVLTVAGLTISGGSKYRSDMPARGGCIHGNGAVTLYYSVVTHCSARSVDSALGGGVFGGYGVALFHSTVSDSTAYTTGNSSYASGGGVYSVGDVVMIASTVSGNAVATASGTHSFGGGLFVYGAALINYSTVSSNTAQHKVGGIALYSGPTGAGLASIYDSTISGNTAYEIGGVYARCQTTLSNSTIAFNHEYQWHDASGHSFAAGLQIGTTLATAQSSIIADNTAPDTGLPGSDLDVSGTAGLAGGYNLVMASNVTLPTDTLTADPDLGPLADNGGPTHTHRPGSSVVIDAGDNPSMHPHDQRGFARTVGAGTDIGAYETDPDAIFINGFN